MHGSATERGKKIMDIYGIFVNEDEFPYAQAIVLGRKTIETRSRNMLKKLVGKRVAIVRTKRGEKPMVIGSVVIEEPWYEEHPEQFRERTCIPVGSKYDEGGRWMYPVHDPIVLDPDEWFPLYRFVIRHGRSWCEW